MAILARNALIAAPLDKTAPLLHLGYHKTGSSWLQAELLRSPRAGFYSPWRPEDYIERLIITNPFAFSPEETRVSFAEGFRHAAENRLVPVITHEMLSGNPWKGGQFNSRATAERLHQTFPEGRVLIVIREQRSMICSLYRHHVRTGLSVSPRRYLMPAEMRSGFEPIFQWAYLEYHWLIGFCQSRFGADRVLVLPFELLKRDCNEFARRVCAFAGAKDPPELTPSIVNAGYSAFTIAVKRRFNSLMRADKAIGHLPWRHQFGEKLFHRLDQHVPRGLARRSNQRLHDQVAEVIGDHYAASNRAVQRMTELKLAEYGYPCH